MFSDASSNVDNGKEEEGLMAMSGGRTDSSGRTK